MGIIRNILFEIKNTEAPPSCLSLVKDFAQAQMAKITLLCVLPSFFDLFSLYNIEQESEKFQNEIEKQTHERLKRLQSEFDGPDGATCSTALSKGNVTKNLIYHSLKNDHDLLVREVALSKETNRMEIDAQDHQLLRHSPCPVWLLRPEKQHSGKVVVAVDGVIDQPLNFELNKKLVQLGKALAHFYGTNMGLLHVWNFDATGILQGSIDRVDYKRIFDAARSASKEGLRRFIEKMPLSEEDCNVHMIQGAPSSSIVEFCNDHDISTLVIGTVGRSGLSGFLVGNTSEKILNKINCSVLIASPKQVASPLEVKIREEIQEHSTAYA